jgi:hypothetical protein
VKDDGLRGRRNIGQVVCVRGSHGRGGGATLGRWLVGVAGGSRPATPAVNRGPPLNFYKHVHISAQFYERSRAKLKILNLIDCEDG